MSLTDIVETYLLVWILVAVAAGIAYPDLAVITQASTPILAVMIGSISLTLSLGQIRDIDPWTLGLVLVGHVTMPFLAFGIAVALGLSAELTVGFVVLGAVTPELVTPVMTDLADGDTALATTALVVVGVGSVVFVPFVVGLLAGDVNVPTSPIVEQLVVAVVAPMLTAVAARAIRPHLVARYDAFYPTVSALMVVLIIGGVTAANAAIITANTDLLATIAVGVIALNLAGYAVGFLVNSRAPRSERIASVLSVGMRDFAVAAALVVAAGLPTIASLPAVAFGVVEMATSAGLANWLAD